MLTAKTWPAACKPHSNDQERPLNIRLLSRISRLCIVYANGIPRRAHTQLAVVASLLCAWRCTTASPGGIDHNSRSSGGLMLPTPAAARRRVDHPEWTAGG